MACINTALRILTAYSCGNKGNSKTRLERSFNATILYKHYVEGIYVPGSFMDVYEVKGRNAKRVLTNGVSA